MSTRYDTNPGSKSAEEVQREVRRVARRGRTDPRGDSATAVPRPDVRPGGGLPARQRGQEFLRNLGATVRDNPVPVVLMGTGLAWLMLVGPARREGATTTRTMISATMPEGPTARATIRRLRSRRLTTTRVRRGRSFAGSPLDGEPVPPGGEAQGTAGKAFAERAKETAEAARRKRSSWGRAVRRIRG